MFNKCKKGMSLVYVMVCLIIIGLTATALIKISHKNALVQINYSQSESARLAVLAGFNKALAFFENEDTSKVLPLLQAWIDKPQNELTESQRWIVGTSKSYDSLYSDCHYKVQLLGFDTATFAISLYSEGLTKQGNRASAFGTYILEGLGFEANTTEEEIEMSALHLGSGADECVAPLKVMKGDTWIDNPKSYLVASEGPHEFHGLFMTGGNTSDEMDIKSAIFHKQAYFKCSIKMDSDKLVCKKGFGIEGNVWSSGVIEVDNGNAYLNGTYTRDGGKEAALAGVHFPSKDTIFGVNSKISDLSSISVGAGATKGSNTTITNIKGKLDITKPEPPKITIDLSEIPASKIYTNPENDFVGWGNYTNIGGALLDSAYIQAKKAGKLWKDFLVIKGRVNANNKFGNTGGGTFTKKIIWIFENVTPSLTSDTPVLKMSDDALFFIYLNNTQAYNYRLPENFHGVLFSENGSITSKHHFKGRGNNAYGAIHIKDRIFRLEGDGGPFNVYYDHDVVKAFIEIDLLVLDGGGGETTVTDDKLVLKQDFLESRLLSRSF